MVDYTTHQSLLVRLSSGSDPAAWRDFHDRYGLLIRRIARRQGLQDADCDEVVQNVLTSLTQAMSQFEYDPAKGKFRGYLKTITLRAVSACQKKQPQLADDCDDASTVIDRDAFESMWETEWRQYHMRQAMKIVRNEFSDSDLQAFDIYGVRNEDASKTAKQLDLSIDQVYQAKSRVLKRLGQLIEAQISEEG